MPSELFFIFCSTAFADSIASSLKTKLNALRSFWSSIFFRKFSNLKLFSNFNGWQGGYAAFTYSIEAKENLIRYVKNQEEHHKTKTFIEELKQLLIEYKIEFDEKYLL